MNRWLVVALVFGMIAAGVLYDRLDIAPLAEEPVALDEGVTPLITDGRLANVWFCPVGSGATGGYATQELNLTNLGDDAAVANVQLITGSGPGPALQVELAPRTSEVVNVADLEPSAQLAAVVEIVGGQGAVSHTVSTVLGQAQSSCGTTTDTTWFFADGVTTRDAFQFVALLNPYPEDASFTMEFQTETRTRAPNELTRASVPGQSVRVVNVGEFVTRESHVATSITVETGSLAVERLQTFNGDLGPRGVALQAATNEPAVDWSLPAGRVHEGGDHRVVVYNPSADQAEVDVAFLLDPDDRTSFGLVPVEVTVLPGRFVVLDLVEALNGYGLPLPYDLGLRVVSANNVAVVVERWQVTPALDTSLIGAGGAQARRLRQTDADPNEVPEEEFTEVEPQVFLQATATVGVASSAGVELLADRWVVPWVDVDADDGTAVIVEGAPGTLVEIRLVVAGEVLPPVRSSIPESGVVTVPVGGAVAAAPILITADQPVAAEVLVVVPDNRLNVVPAVPIVAPASSEEASP